MSHIDTIVKEQYEEYRQFMKDIGLDISEHKDNFFIYHHTL